MMNNGLLLWVDDEIELLKAIYEYKHTINR